MGYYPRTLCPTFLNDGKWHLIGAIHEQKLHELSIKGFTSYQECLDIMITYNYTEFKL